MNYPQTLTMTSHFSWAPIVDLRRTGLSVCAHDMASRGHSPVRLAK